MRSMTGFGESHLHTETHRFSARCRSVNHRNLDVRVFLPPTLQNLELGFNQYVKRHFHRGRIELRIEIENQIQERAGDTYQDAFEELQMLEQRFGLKPTLADLLSIKSSLKKKTPPEIDIEGLDALVEEVCESLIQSRAEEGGRLKPVIGSLIQDITTRVGVIQRLSEKNSRDLFSKLRTRLEHQIEAWDLQRIDENRLAEELVFHVDRYDISEEIQRIYSHIEAVNVLIENDGLKVMGKKLDFYMQEFFRETNTIGSKTNLAAITNEVVGLKITIEKIREQAANIE